MIYNVFIAIGVVAIILVLIAERRWQKKNGVRVYELSDTVTNTACGISDRVFNIFFDTFQFIIWAKIFTYVALIQIPVTLWSWFLCLFAVDFIWYWYHRLGHEVRVFWAIHSLHHQSEEFNISVGFRISIFQSLMRGIFWMILPILGFHPETILTVLVFHGLYQLPQHTRVMPRLGFLEYIFVTPSAHRVHHASNEHYLDKNYGGVFVIWDRLFGTYAKEEEEPIYGLTERAGTLGFLEAHIYGFRQLILPGNVHIPFREKLRYWFGKPSFVPAAIGEKIKPEVKQFQVLPVLSRYVLCQIVMASIITVFFIFNRESWVPGLKSAMVFLIFWTLASATLNYSAVNKPLIAHEIIRNIGIGAVTLYLWYQHLASWYFVILVLVAVLISLLFIPYKKAESS